jgi:hypothetical protein
MESNKAKSTNELSRFMDLGTAARLLALKRSGVGWPGLKEAQPAIAAGNGGLFIPRRAIVRFVGRPR